MTQYKVSFEVTGNLVVEADSPEEAKETVCELCADANNDAFDAVNTDITNIEEVPEEESDDEEIDPDDVMPTIAEQLDNIEVAGLSLDEDGQLVFYADIYQWKDGTYHTTQEKS